MIIEASLKIGNGSYKFIIDEKSDLEALNKAITLSNPPFFCNCCKVSTKFKFSSNKDGESNVYVNMVCEDCGARSKLGSYKSGGFFWHKFEVYDKEAKKK